MKNYLRFMYKYMHIDYYIFCLIVLCLLGCYLKVSHLYTILCYNMIAVACMPSKIEYEQARKEGLIKSKK